MEPTDDLEMAAAWVATELTKAGYRADYSPRSLWVVEQFIDQELSQFALGTAGPFGDDVGFTLDALGAYVGAVCRRSLGGEWHDAPDQSGSWLMTGHGTQIWPIDRVMKRYKFGPSESIAAYGAGLGLDIGSAPKPPRKRRASRGSGRRRERDHVWMAVFGAVLLVAGGGIAASGNTWLGIIALAFAVVSFCGSVMLWPGVKDRTREIAGILGSVGFTVMGTLMVVSYFVAPEALGSRSLPGMIAGILAVAFFGPGSLILLYRMVRRRPV